MKKTRNTRHTPVRTCSFWAKRLAALRPKDLNKPENAELAEHLKTCVSCQRLYKEYQQVAEMIRALPDLHMRAGLPPQLLKEWEELDKAEQSPAARVSVKKVQLITTSRTLPDRIAPSRYPSAEPLIALPFADADEWQSEETPTVLFC
jgi:hypothetical protein